MPAPVVANVATNAAASTTTPSCSVPAGIASGDLLVAFLQVRQSTTTLDVAAQGATWNKLAQVAGTNQNARVFWKIAGAGEPQTTYTFSSSVGGAYTVSVLRIVGHHATTPIQAESGTANAASSANQTVPSVSGVVDGLWLGYVAAPTGGASTSWSTPTGWDADNHSDLFTGSQSTQTSSASAREQLTATGATGTATFVRAAAATWIGWSVVVAPSGGDTTPPTVVLLSGLTATVSPTASYAYDFQTNEACQAWKVKVVPASNSLHTAGTLIESGGALAASQSVTGTITAAELQAAGVAEGAAARVAFFTQDLAGNWSTLP